MALIFFWSPSGVSAKVAIIKSSIFRLSIAKDYPVGGRYSTIPWWIFSQQPDYFL
jgi:hypothetical protein